MFKYSEIFTPLLPIVCFYKLQGIVYLKNLEICKEYFTFVQVKFT